MKNSKQNKCKYISLKRFHPGSLQGYFNLLLLDFYRKWLKFYAAIFRRICFNVSLFIAGNFYTTFSNLTDKWCNCQLSHIFGYRVKLLFTRMDNLIINKFACCSTINS